MVRWLKRHVNLPERLLIERAKRGDKEAFGSLYLKYLDQIYRYVYFRVNQNKEDAEDIVEIVFFKAWENMEKFASNEQGIQAWLYRIARNTLIDHYRLNKPKAVLHENIAAADGELDESLDRELRINQVLSLMQELSEEQREVMMLRFVEDMSTREIALHLNKKEDAVRALQYRGLKKLKKRMKKQI